MRASTWVDRITDESNPWLNAIKGEDERDYAGATSFYLKDATESLRQNMPARAALSAACAADCLEKMSLFDDARLMFMETASIYAENADRVTGSSVRELLWSLQESCLFYLRAGETAKSGEVYKRYATIAKRVNLFNGDATNRMFVMGKEIEKSSGERKGITQPSSRPQIAAEVEQFLQLRKTGLRKSNAQVRLRPPTSRKNERGNGYLEKNIINQLG